MGGQCSCADHEEGLGVRAGEVEGGEGGDGGGTVEGELGAVEGG